MPLDQLLPFLPLAAAVLGGLLFWWLSRRRGDGEAEQEADDQRIDLGSLPQAVPGEGAQLEIYGVAVRLAAVVVAPAGRGDPPTVEEAELVVGQLAPRMDAVVRQHPPKWMCWPGQLSGQGFRSKFSHCAALPGDRGRGSRWCAAAGKLTLGDRQWLIGMVLCSEAPNPLGDIEVDHEGRWPDVLRVRAEAGAS